MIEGYKPLENADAMPNGEVQEKIIQAALSRTGSEIAGVSVVDREHFLEKVQNGEITADRLDEEVIKNIPAPFDSEGIQNLYAILQADSGLWNTFVLLNKRSTPFSSEDVGVGTEPTPDDLKSFCDNYPTPRVFEDTFINSDVGIEQLGEAGSGWREQGKIADRRLMSTLYGERNEYWQQAKMLLEAGS